MIKNLIVGAISSNYSISDVTPWIKSINSWRNEEDCEVVLLYYVAEEDQYEKHQEIHEFLKSHNITMYAPTQDMYKRTIGIYNTDTGKANKGNVDTLVHNIRFFDIFKLLTTTAYSKVLITDVKDLVVVKNPFSTDLGKAEHNIIASSEEVVYGSHPWNNQHLMTTLGVCSYELLPKSVYNVGCVYGDASYIKDLCLNIYLIAKGVSLVADQTAYNHLLSTKLYKENTYFSNLSDKWGVHLHVINEGHVEFDMNTLEEYVIIHQYDRIDELKKEILNNYSL